MAFVPGFLHDVFVSYACVNNQQAGGLVSHFWQLLTVALQAEGLRLQADGRPDGVDVFLDHRSMESGSDLTDQVLAGARSSAVFIAFHSPAYLLSDWCQAEAREFTANYDQARPNLAGRLFVVALDPAGLPEKSDIGLIRNRPYRPFFYNHPRGGTFAFEPGHPDLTNSLDYTLKEETTLMAKEIAGTLKAMRQAAPVPRVFLADTSPAWRKHAEDIKDWLVQRGVLVLRASPTDGPWQETSRRLIAGADLFVTISETAPHDAATVQAEMARVAGRPGVRWRQRGETPAVMTAAAAAAASDPVPPAAPPPDGFPTVEETLEEFKEVVASRLVKPGPRHRPASPAQAPDPSESTVLVVGAEKDTACVVLIEAELDPLGCGRDAFLTEDTVLKPDAWREDLGELLRFHRPAAVVFVDGTCAAPWADKRLRDLLLILGDAVPQPRVALCHFPPRPKTDRRYVPPKGRVVRLDETQLAQLRTLL